MANTCRYTVEDTGPLGIRMHMPIPIGMLTLALVALNQSGLLFRWHSGISICAFDTATGKEIWKRPTAGWHQSAAR